LKHVLTIDIGTTSAKILLVSQDGDVVASEQEFYPTQFSHHGWAEQDAALILAAIKRLVSDLVAKHSGKVSVISLSCAMHSIMAVDEKGKPLSHLIIWSDMRSAAIAKQIRSTPRAAALLDVTGTPVHPMSPICKLLWIRENDPDLFKRAFKFISIKEFLIWHWTGQWMVDYSVASSSGLFDIRKLAWSDDALSLAGIGVEKLSRCVSPYHRIPLKSEVAKGFGFANNLVVVAGASDGCLAHLGSNATSPGDVSLTIGTSGAVRKLSAVASGDRQGRLFNYRMDETTFITGGATNNGTVVIDWFRKNFCRSADGSLQDFVNETKQISPGSEGLIFLPFVLGERSPYYDPDLRGVFFGLAQHHSLQHMMRSLLEGVCFEMRSLVDAVSETVGPVDRVLASGGFIRSADWIQMLSNVLGREVLVSDVNDASSMGAAMVGFQSLGVKYNRQQDDCGHRFIPEPSSSEIYNLMYPLFTKLVHKLTDEFEEVARLQQRTLFRM
jgi:gluconokinase